VKVTPAHDQNDYAVGQRHKLPMIGVLTLDAKINAEAPAAYQGLDRFVARKKVVADLEAMGALVEVKKHKLMVPRCAPHEPGDRADADRPVVRGHDQGQRHRPDGQEHHPEGHRRGEVRRGEVLCPRTGSTRTTSG
jgi:hypothetical protein